MNIIPHTIINANKNNNTKNNKKLTNLQGDVLTTISGF